jgi:hypothetical protein
MLIAIPSKGRARNTPSTGVLKSATLFVPESEMHQYKGTHEKIVGVPNEVKGITATRNWILKNGGAQWVVFVDDDVKVQGWVKLYKEKCKHFKLTEAEWVKTFERLFDFTEQLDFKIWGVATSSEPRAVYPYKPVLTRSYVTASCMGIVNDGTYLFDESFTVKEDYEICLRHIKERGGILCARNVYWENSHWKDDGGCKSYRTQKTEAECIRKLIKLYPGFIREVRRGGSEFSIQLNF